MFFFFFFSSRRRHTRFDCDWSSDVCSSDLDTIKCVLAYYASIGTFAGPKSPGSAYVIMHHIMGEHQGAGGWGFIKGGMGAITQAIAASGKRFGLEVMTDAPVAEVLVINGRATGVRTGDG